MSITEIQEIATPVAPFAATGAEIPATLPEEDKRSRSANRGNPFAPPESSSRSPSRIARSLSRTRDAIMNVITGKDGVESSAVNPRAASRGRGSQSRDRSGAASPAADRSGRSLSRTRDAIMNAMNGVEKSSVNPRGYGAASRSPSRGRASGASTPARTGRSLSRVRDTVGAVKDAIMQPSPVDSTLVNPRYYSASSRSQSRSRNTESTLNIDTVLEDADKTSEDKAFSLVNPRGFNSASRSRSRAKEESVPATPLDTW